MRKDHFRPCLEKLECRIQPTAYRTPFLDFGPYIAPGEDPNLGPGQITLQELTQRIQAIAPYTDGIRTYDCTGDLQPAAGIIHSLGKKAAIGTYLNGNAAHDQAQLDALVAQAMQGTVDVAIVGNENLLATAPNPLPEATLLNDISQVKTRFANAGLHIPVTTSDTYGDLESHPNVLAAVDIVYAHFYPFYESTSIDLAVPTLSRAYRQLQAMTLGKQVVIGETGWPSAGSTPNGVSVPSPENAARYFLEFVSWARANGVTYSYFEVYDEPWKASMGDFNAHWGLFDSNEVLKPGMESVFDGTTVSPAIDFFALPSTVRTNIGTFVIAGVTIPGYTVAVGGVPLPPGEMDSLGAFAHTVSLAPGNNTLTVTVTNSLGQPVEAGTKVAVYDPTYSTAGLQLLYVDTASPVLDGTVVIDVMNNAVLGLIAGRHVRGISPDAREVYMDDRTVLSTGTHQTLRTLPFSQAIPSNGFLVSPTGTRLFSRNEVVDVAANALLTPLPVDITTGNSYGGVPIPGGPAISPDGSVIFADNPVVRITLATGAVAATGITGGNGFVSDLALSADGTKLLMSFYAGAAGAAAIYDANGFQSLGFVAIGDFTGEIQFLSSTVVVVGNSGNPVQLRGAVTVFNPATAQVLQTVPDMMADNLTVSAAKDQVFATTGDRVGVDVFLVGTGGALSLGKTFVLGTGQFFQGSGVYQNDQLRKLVFKSAPPR
ncbi:MAG TPA: glycosyl hydrolase family 17 protein, partial [Gemmataceae bacterium]